ncbi:hypothetical protein TRAPUB_11490 [Trametes pubescens]|uniref:C2H2-type domain-containing protein n=1 Tax=Trametes pubescens TaxID=154538 RepID=A0A1M2VWL3_TRAPU|nr:hypothetical protein TRAPUB_11490 [Trametes pubescens]
MPPQREHESTQEDIIKNGPAKGKCPECGKVFRKDLKRHRMVHLPKGHIECPRCDETFHQRAHLQLHMDKSHLLVWRHACDFFYINERNEKTRCEDVFNDPSVLTRHKKQKHGYVPKAKDQTCEAKPRSHEDQVKDQRRVDMRIAKGTQRLKPGRNDAPGAEALRPQLSSDSRLAGPVAPGALFALLSAPAPLSPAVRETSRPHPSAYTRTHGSSSSSSSQGSGSSSHRSLRPTPPHHQPVASGSSSRTTSTTSSRPRVSTNMPAPASMSPASSYNSAIGVVNDPFGPYSVSPASMSPSYLRPDYYPTDPAYQQGVFGQVHSNQFLASGVQPAYVQHHSPTRPHQGWNPDNSGFSSYSYPDTGMGMNMSDPLGVPNTLALNTTPQMPLMGMPSGYSPDTQRWNSREPSPRSSPPSASSSRGGETQNAYAYHYHIGGRR